MKIRHISSLNLWLLSKGKTVLYRGPENPFDSPRVIAAALKRAGYIA
ncbi:MAG: hypothetical protein VX745_06000 [Pseudomonadota bacterium]|nr:hypothetical protein [Pseudomonadota bacterium]